MAIGIRVLVADDVRTNRLFLKGLLEREGFLVVEACDGAEALARINAKEVDLALLDVMMPVMDGFAACREIRKTLSASEFPVLFITAKAEDVDLCEGFLVGGNDYITKPVNPTILRARLGAQVQLLSAHRALAETYSRLARKKRMETIGVFSAAIAHNFNNILGTVIGSSELIQLCSEEDSEVFRAAELVIAAGRRGADLIDGLVSFTKPLPSRAKTSAIQVVESVVSFVKSVAPSAIDISFIVDGAERELAIPAEDLGSVVLELLKNSISAVDRGGKICVTLSAAGPESRAARHARITVEDNGCGIDPRIRDHVFEPFYSTKNVDSSGTMSLDGSGLGLSTTFQIVTAAGGTIEVIKSDSSGTVIEVVLPLAT